MNRKAALGNNGTHQRGRRCEAADGQGGAELDAVGAPTASLQTGGQGFRAQLKGERGMQWLVLAYGAMRTVWTPAWLCKA